LRHLKKILFATAILAMVAVAPAQTQTPSRNALPLKAVPSKTLTPQQKFVLDTVKLAISLPEPDPQDRLRVLASAANVVSSIDRRMARNLRREGTRIESELIQLGKTPAVSLMSLGQADCASAQSFVENVPETSVVAAEQALIGAVTTCPKQTLQIVARRLSAALEKKIVAPRALMATAQAMGIKSPWSQTHFEKLFGSLPDSNDSSAEAQNFAAFYAQMAADVDKEVATKTGLEMLEWLAKMNDIPLRVLSVNIVSGAMKHALGEKGFQAALEANVTAASLVRNTENSGTKGGVERPPLESASVLAAMKQQGADQSDRLREMPAGQRAREAAAHGFAAGNSSEKQQSATYFDMAFAAVDEVWESRTPEQNAAAVVEEVSEAAAQIDPMNAMTRAQQLRDPSAQAIAMLAVARVVASKGALSSQPLNHTEGVVH
jgi:hypothetical protein